MRRVIAAVALVGATLSPLGISVANAAPTTQVVSGTLTDSSGITSTVAGYSVVYLTDSGLSRRAKIGTTGTFSFTVPSATLYGATLQVVRPNGRYAGPVVLKQDNLGTTTGSGLRAANLNAAAHIQFAGVGVSLGKVRLVTSSGNAVGAYVVGPISPNKAASASNWYRKTAVRSYLIGTTLGGSLPSIRKFGLAAPLAFTSAELGKLSGAPAKMTPRGGTDPTLTGNGGDQDGDGIPNTFDVDDNGNQTLDAVDPRSSITAAANPWTDIRREYQNGGSTFNAGLSGVSTTDVATTIGGQGQFGLWFFISEQMLKNAAGTSSAIDFARVDCGSLVYCGTAPAGSTQYTTNFGAPGEAQNGFSSQYGNGPVNWADVNGGAYGCGNATGDFSRSDAGLGPNDPLNGLLLMCRNNGQGVERIWTGMLAPQTGSETLNVFTPGDVYTVTFRVHGQTALSTMAMTLAPYFATVPGLTAVNGSAPASNGVVAPSGNNLTLTFLRPQRLSLPGEPQPFMDQSGLHYGVIIGVENSEYGCQPSRYSALGGLSAGTAGASSDRNLWPLTDTSSTDEAVNAANTRTLTVDLLHCFADLAATLGHKITVTNNTYITLTAAGEFLTGGANRSTLMLRLSIPSGGAFDTYVNHS